MLHRESGAYDIDVVQFYFVECTIVAGKKGKMMERRILKDFQIGIVETIVTEAVRGSSEARDVFSTIAKAMNKRQSKKYDEHAAFCENRFNEFHFNSCV